MAAKGKAGRPPFQPTDEQVYSVETMASIGVPREAIAGALGIDLKTLRKHFREQLDNGKTRTVTKVADSLVRQALAGNMTAAIFYLKTQAGWKEPQQIDLTNSDGSMRQPTEIRLVAGTNDNSND